MQKSYECENEHLWQFLPMPHKQDTEVREVVREVVRELVRHGERNGRGA
jgi:hypothetical protein